jgi:hypothetical protein
MNADSLYKMLRASCLSQPLVALVVVVLFFPIAKLDHPRYILPFIGYGCICTFLIGLWALLIVRRYSEAKSRQDLRKQTALFLRQLVALALVFYTGATFALSAGGYFLWCVALFCALSFIVPPLIFVSLFYKMTNHGNEKFSGWLILRNPLSRMHLYFFIAPIISIISSWWLLRTGILGQPDVLTVIVFSIPFTMFIAVSAVPLLCWMLFRNLDSADGDC